MQAHGEFSSSRLKGFFRLDLSFAAYSSNSVCISLIIKILAIDVLYRYNTLSDVDLSLRMSI